MTKTTQHRRELVSRTSSLIDEESPGAEVVEILDKYLTVRAYRANQVLWTEGEVSGRLVVLEQGRVKILRTQPDGRSVLLFVFGPGEVFGFLPFIDGGPYPATAIAIDDIRARVMSRSALRVAVAEDPHVAMVLLQALGRRLRQSFDRVDDQSRHDATARVAAALLLLLPSSGDEDALSVIEVPTPAYAFAEDMGLKAETFSRAVTRLVDLSVLHRLGTGKLQVLDIVRLRRAAAGGSLESPPRKTTGIDPGSRRSAPRGPCSESRPAMVADPARGERP